jgi:hypothetical protein
MVSASASALVLGEEVGVMPGGDTEQSPLSVTQVEGVLRVHVDAARTPFS